MIVTVKLIGPLVQACGFGEKGFDVPEGTTTAALLGRLDGLAPNRPRIVTRNGKAVGADDALADGDRVVVAPIYSGG